jgi:hypothetical protein
MKIWDWNEWHAFWYGWGVGVTRDNSNIKPEYIQGERHYYKVGQGIGALMWVIVPALIAALFIRFVI